MVHDQWPDLQTIPVVILWEGDYYSHFRGSLKGVLALGLFHSGRESYYVETFIQVTHNSGNSTSSGEGSVLESNHKQSLANPYCNNPGFL